MEPKYSNDEQYLRYLHLGDYDVTDLQENNMLTRAIEMRLPRSAIYMLIDLKIKEKARSRDETLKRIVSMQAWDLAMECINPDSAHRSLWILSSHYKVYIPDLEFFRGQGPDRLDIYREFNTLVQSSKVVNLY